MPLVTQHARHALVREVTTASLALFQTFWLGQHVSPNVQVECSTVRPLILVNCVTQLVKHVADRLLVTASLVKVFFITYFGIIHVHVYLSTLTVLVCFLIGICFSEKIAEC